MYYTAFARDVQVFWFSTFEIAEYSCSSESKPSDFKLFKIPTINTVLKSFFLQESLKIGEFSPVWVIIISPPSTLKIMLRNLVQCLLILWSCDNLVCCVDLYGMPDRSGTNHLVRCVELVKLKHLFTTFTRKTQKIFFDWQILPLFRGIFCPKTAVLQGFCRWHHRWHKNDVILQRKLL